MLTDCFKCINNYFLFLLEIILIVRFWCIFTLVIPTRYHYISDLSKQYNVIAKYLLSMHHVDHP